MQWHGKDHWSFNVGFVGVSHAGVVTVAHLLCFSMTILGEIGTINVGERIIHRWDHRPQERR
jgi:hypothetical protein